MAAEVSIMHDGCQPHAIVTQHLVTTQQVAGCISPRLHRGITRLHRLVHRGIYKLQAILQGSSLHSIWTTHDQHNIITHTCITLFVYMTAWKVTTAAIAGASLTKRLEEKD